MKPRYELKGSYQTLYEEYLDFCLPRTSAQGFETIKKSTYYCLRWFARKGIALETAEYNDGNNYKRYLSRKRKKDGNRLSVGTTLNRLKALKKFFAYLKERKIIASNPYAGLKYPRLPEHYGRNILNVVQMGNLLQTLGRFDEGETLRERRRQYKVHVIAEFLYATGLRIEEAARVAPEDLDFRERFVSVRKGKDGKARIGFMTVYAAEVVGVYMTVTRERVWGNYSRKGGERVFGVGTGRLTALVKRHCQRLGLPVISSHGFRHSLGTHIHQAGCEDKAYRSIGLLQ